MRHAAGPGVLLARAFGLFALAVAAPGCSVLGAAAAKVGSVQVKPAYTGLKGQSVAVMVSAERGLLNDFPALQLDIARGVLQKLDGAVKAKSEELRDTRFPKEAGPDAVLAFQRNYPTLMYEPVTEIAPRLNVGRLIYIEVENLQTHPDAVPELFRGNLAGRLQVVEVNGGRAKVGYETRVQVGFPDKSPEEGLPDLGEAKTYAGTVDKFSTTVLEKFVTHPEED